MTGHDRRFKVSATRLLRSRSRILAASLVLLIVIVLLLMRLDVGRIVETVRGLKILETTLGIIAFALAQLAFATRWWCLIDRARRPSAATTLDYSLIGGMLNALLPLRAGDVGRALLLSRRHLIRLGDAGGTIAVERLSDALTVVVLGATLALALVVPSPAIDGLVILALLVAGAAVLGAFALQPQMIGRLRHLAEGRLPMGVARRVANGIEGLVETGLRLKSPRVLLTALLAHILGWLAVILALAVFLPALSIDVPPIKGALSVLLLTSLGGIVIQVPAGIGAWHMLAAGALTYWKVPVEVGVAYAIVAHGVGIAVPVLAGLVSTIRVGKIGDVLCLLRAGDIHEETV